MHKELTREHCGDPHLQGRGQGRRQRGAAVERSQQRLSSSQGSSAPGRPAGLPHAEARAKGQAFLHALTPSGLAMGALTPEGGGSPHRGQVRGGAPAGCSGEEGFGAGGPGGAPRPPRYYRAFLGWPRGAPHTPLDSLPGEWTSGWHGFTTR